MKKTILITGSSDGIGKLAAIKLAKKGNKIIIHGRNNDKVKRVISEIKSSTNNLDIEGISADLSEVDNIKNLSEYINKNFTKLDVLINNAGVYNSSTDFNKAGINIQFAINYLAPYQLTYNLLPLLKKADSARIINLSSAAQSPVSLEALKGEEKLLTGEAYAQSKLALTMWSMYLAKILNNISVIPVNPGSLLNTRMVKEAFGKFWSSADKGADILLDLSVSKKYSGISGKYFDNDKGNFGNAHPDAYNDDKIARLIEISEKLTLVKYG